MQIARGNWKPPRWLARWLCPVIGHRWLVNSGNDWRCCSRCGREEARARREVWKD